jgi:hypothetical protein
MMYKCHVRRRRLAGHDRKVANVCLIGGWFILTHTLLAATVLRISEHWPLNRLIAILCDSLVNVVGARYLCLIVRFVTYMKAECSEISLFAVVLSLAKL